MKRRVIITKLPQAGSGLDVKMQGLKAGLGFNANTMPWAVMAGHMSAPDVEVNSTLKPVPRSKANVEAEKGEIASVPGEGGIPSTFKIAGERHHSGGTPLNLPKDSFIFSDTNAMKIKDPEILAQFGITTTSNMTPAGIAKKYDVNKWKGILADPDTDDIQRKTAEMMISNYNLKLAKLGLVQESKKGFPQGIPKVAMPYIESLQINPDDMVDMNPGFGGTNEMMDNMAKYGGLIKYAMAGEVPNADPIDVEPWKSKNEKITPTKRNSDAPYTKAQYNELFKKMGIDTDKLTPKQAQEALYNKADPFEKAYMWGVYGHTKQGVEALKKQGVTDKEAYQLKQYAPLKDAAGNVIENKAEYKKRMSSKYTPDQLAAELEPLSSSFADNMHGARVALLLNKDKEVPVVPGEPATTTPANQPAANTPVTTTAQHIIPQLRAPQETPWWIQDIIKTGNAAGNYMGVKKYNPSQASEAVFTPEVTFKNPTRELAANSERLNIGANTLAQFTGPQSFNARFNQMSGQSAGTAADILSRYNNDNIQISNGQAAQNAGIMNDYAQRKAFGNTSLYDKYQIANQQFDNSRSQARDVLVNQFVQGITNKNYTANLNKMYPQYAVDPLIGGEFRFHNPREFDGKVNPQKSVDQIYEDMLASHATFQNTPEGQKRAWEAAKIKAGIKDQNAFDNYNPNQGVTPFQYPGG